MTRQITSVVGGGTVAGGDAHVDVNPSDLGDVVLEYGGVDADTAKAALESAAATFPIWSRTTPWERSMVLDKAGTEVLARAAELGDLLAREEGKTLPEARGEVVRAGQILKYFAGNVLAPHGHVLDSVRSGVEVSVTREPIGVVSVITPWNFPIAIPAWKIAPALAYGNTVVFKPAELVPGSAWELVDILNRAGLPAGGLNLVLGRGSVVGPVLTTDPLVNGVTFTGSVGTGRGILDAHAPLGRKVQLELGGKNAVIVLEDADIDAAASAIAFGAWFHQGQICMTTGRILAQNKIVAALTEKLVAKANHLPVGDPLGQVALGPVINKAQVQRIDGIVKDSVAAGAKLEAGGTFDGPFYKPTVLTGVKPGMRAFDEEIFGPVAAITSIGSDDEAVQLANHNEYGLSAGVFSTDVGRAIAVGNRLNTGLLHINDQTVADEPHIPFGGSGASGNGTRIGGPANWDEFTQWQWMTIKDKPNPYPF